MALVSVACAFCLFLRTSPEDRARQHRALATRGLAAYLAERFPTHRALVVANPFTQRPGLPEGIYAQEEAGIRGLQAGFDHRIVLEEVVFPSLKSKAQQDPRSVEIDPTTSTPLSYLVAEDAFDKLVQAHPDCDLIVSLIGLPAELGRVEAWRPTSVVKFALLFPDLRMIGSKAALREAVKREKLAAFVLPRPNAPSDQTPMGRNLKVEFERRFLLVTPHNVDQMLEAHPRLFELVSPGGG